MSVIKGNKWLFSLFGFFILLSACFTLTHSLMSSVHAAGTNNTKGHVDYSLATLSQAATIYINTLSSPGYHGAVEINGILPANAGGFVGFYDSDATDKSSWMAGRDSSNVVTWSYSQLGSIRDSDADVGTNNAAQGYALFGYMLSQIGLDEVNVGNNTNGFRMITGILMLALYIMSVGMDMFFNLVISILMTINPFGLFARATRLAAVRDSGGGTIPDNIGSAQVATVSIGSYLNDILDSIGNAYDVLYNLSFAIVLPVMLAFGFFMWLVIHKGQGFLATFKPIVIRIIFVVIGVPFMFSLYDVVLSSARGTVKVSDSPPTKVIGSLFCDFESWVYSDDNLSLPTFGTNYIVSLQDGVSSSTASHARQICYAVNKQNYPSNVFPGTVGSVTSDLYKDYADYDKEIMKIGDKPRYEVVGGSGGFNVNDMADNSTLTSQIPTVSAVVNILSRYISGATISASDYESAVVKKTLATSAEGAVILFGTSSTWEDYDSMQVKEFEYDGNDGGAGGTGTSRNTNINVELTADNVKTLAEKRWTSASYQVSTYSGVPNVFCAANPMAMSPGSGTGTWSYAPGGGGLSMMSMYNYLNSQFGASSVRVTSPNQSTNDQVKYEHYSVAMVGHGIMRVIYFLDALLLLGSVAIIGYGYGFAMLIGNFRAMIQLVPKVMVGMIGSINGIAAAMALTFALISEVGVTVILFDIAVSIVYALYGLIEFPLAAIFKNFFGDSFDSVMGGTLFVALLGIISIVVIFATCKKLLQWRTAVVGATTAACTNVIKKLLQAEVATPDLDTPASSMLGKVATTAGLAAGVVSYANGAGLISPDAKASLKNNKEAMMSALTGNKGANNLNDALNSALNVKSGGKGSNPVNTGMSMSSNSLANLQRQGAHASERNGISDSAYADVSKSMEGEFLSDLNGRGSSGGDYSTNADATNAGNVLASDAPTDKTLKDFRDDGQRVDDIAPKTNKMHKSYKDEEHGTSADISSYVDENGNTVTETTEINSTDGSKMKSKLVDNSDTSELTTDSFSHGKKTEHSEVITDKATGDQKIHKEIKEKGGKVIIDQEYTHDDAGNAVITENKRGKSAELGNYHSTTTSTVDGITGDKHSVTQVVSQKGGTTTVQEDVRVDKAKGQTITTGTKLNADGTKSEYSVSHNSSSGAIMQSSETVYDKVGNVSERTIKHVQNVNNQQRTITQTVKGSVSTTETEIIASDGMSKVVETSVSKGGASPVKTTTNYTYNTTTQEFEKTNVVENNNVYTANVRTEIKNTNTVTAQDGGTSSVFNDTPLPYNTSGSTSRGSSGSQLGPGGRPIGRM